MQDLKQAIKKYFQEREDTIAVYLYGSRAAGTDVPGSDVDIAVLSEPYKKKMDSFHARTRLQKDLSRLLRKDVDIVFLQEAGEALLFEVLRKGEIILERGERSHHIFVVSRLTQCLDFQFYQKRMQTGLIQAVRRTKLG